MCVSFPLGQSVWVPHPHQNRSDQTIMQSANQQVLMDPKAFATVDREVRGRERSVYYPEEVGGYAPMEPESTQMGWCQTKEHNTTVTFSRIGESSMKMKDSIWEEVTAKSLLQYSPLPPLPATTAPDTGCQWTLSILRPLECEGHDAVLLRVRSVCHSPHCDSPWLPQDSAHCDDGSQWAPPSPASGLGVPGKARSAPAWAGRVAVLGHGNRWRHNHSQWMQPHLTPRRDQLE